MKKKIWLFSILLSAAIGIQAQTVYFSQDFNSSTSYLTYVGTGQNQFDGLAFSGNSGINTLNNKLRVIKNGGTGTNRAAITKTNTPFNPTSNSGFLKFEMEITISSNTPGVNVTNGFLFSVGGAMGGTHVDDPNIIYVHSRLYISPAATAGTFVIKGGGPSTPVLTSAPLSGTQKLVWYINNIGNPAGYTAPDGTLASVMDDAADVWAIDETGKATLVLDEIPATTPATDRLRTFKVSNNDNFVATLDIDDMVITEEPVIMLKKITAISPVEPVTAPIKTIFSLLPLPGQVDVILEDGSQEKVAVRWSAVTQYNPYKLGEYEVKGDVIPNSGTINFNQLTVTTKVILQDGIKIVNAFSPNGDGINDTWIIPDLQRYKKISVDVFDRDGNHLFHSTDPAIGWDGRNKNGRIVPGSYFYTIKVPDLILVKKGVLTVLK